MFNITVFKMTIPANLAGEVAPQTKTDGFRLASGQIFFQSQYKAPQVFPIF
jgi:hypothetical protein